MTLPITVVREVERVSSGELSLAASYMQSNYHRHIPPTTTTTTSNTTTASLQFSEISQQTCDSSVRVIGLSCFGLRSLTGCRRLKEHGEMTKLSEAVSLQRGGLHRNHL